MKAGKDLQGIAVCLGCDELTRITSEELGAIQENRGFCNICRGKQFKLFWPDPPLTDLVHMTDEMFMKVCAIGGDDGRESRHVGSFQTSRPEGSAPTERVGKG